MKKALIVGLTGQTGAGKSTVGAVFGQAGFSVIDCDRVAREVTDPGSDCLRELVRLFGKQILRPDLSLDRKALAKIVFSDPGELKRLNQAIFPFITERIRHHIAACEQAGAEVVLLDAPTLFESGADRLCGKIVSVTACDSLRLQRIRERDGLTEEEARRRMDSQLPESFFISHSDFVVRNNGTREELAEQARRVARSLKEYADDH